MPALVASIHVLFFVMLQRVDGGDKPGHDGRWVRSQALNRCRYAKSTASAPFTALALSITVRSSAAACTEMFSAKNRASVTGKQCRSLGWHHRAFATLPRSVSSTEQQQPAGQEKRQRPDQVDVEPGASQDLEPDPLVDGDRDGRGDGQHRQRVNPYSQQRGEQGAARRC